MRSAHKVVGPSQASITLPWVERKRGQNFLLTAVSLHVFVWFKKQAAHRHVVASVERFVKMLSQDENHPVLRPQLTEYLVEPTRSGDPAG
jgi:hypothetical protein